MEDLNASQTNVVSEALAACEKDKAVLTNQLETVNEKLAATKNKANNINRILKLFLLSFVYSHLTVSINFELLGDGSKIFYLRRNEVDNYVTYFYGIGCLISILDKEQFESLGRTISNFLPARNSQ